MTGAKLITEADIDWNKYLSDDEACRIVPADEYVMQVMEFMVNGGNTRGIRLPWSKCAGQVVLRPGEFIVWAGVNGHGKSLLLSQVMLGAMQQNDSVVIASLELHPVQTLLRMQQQFCGTGSPSVQSIEYFHSWLHNRMWLYDRQGQVDYRRMFAVIRYCREELGTDHFVIDSLMKCGLGVDDYNGQKAFVDLLSTYAKSSGMTIHLVAHSRKREKSTDMMDKFDVKGCGEITDMADSVFSLWRNVRKEEARQRDDFSRDTEPDAILVCDKQRHGAWEGKIALTFVPKAQQFSGRMDPHRAIDYEGQTKCNAVAED